MSSIVSSPNSMNTSPVSQMDLPNRMRFGMDKNGQKVQRTILWNPQRTADITYRISETVNNKTKSEDYALNRSDIVFIKLKNKDGISFPKAQILSFDFNSAPPLLNIAWLVGDYVGCEKGQVHIETVQDWHSPVKFLNDSPVILIE